MLKNYMFEYRGEMMNHLLQNMNPQQKQAIETTEGPLLVMAGAGSGKTRVLTHRIAYLMSEKLVAPYNILAITFTNKAAREMKERVEKLIGDRGKDVWISTFHSMCVRILRRDIDLIGYDLNFGILDDTDQLSVIKTVMEELNLDPKRQSPKYFLNQISNAKNELKTPRDLRKEFENEDVIRVYEKYQQVLFKNNRVDFDDLLMLTVHLFEKEPEVLAFYQNKFQYIHIDEYQDTNNAQYTIVKMLAKKFRNICVVGDSDQSIYSWRGANIENILSFESDYPDASVVLLEQNYRSKQMILNAANDVIKNNSGRRDKQLWSDRGEGEAIEYHRASDGDVEANYIITSIHPDGLQRGNNIFVNKTLITYDISQPCNKTGTATFNAEVLDGQGRPLSNASVTFLIAGKVLTKITDEKGIAFINIKAYPGVYTITTTYNGYSVGKTLEIYNNETGFKRYNLGSNDNGTVYLYKSIGNASSNVRIAYIIGVHVTENAVHKALFDELTNKSSELNYCYDIYKINVNPIGEPIDDINRMRGQLLGRDYVVPEAIKNNYSLVVDVHSNQGGAYVITNFVFAPAQDNVSKVIATKIINDNPGLQEYFPASQTSPAYVTLPIQRSGTPTILYETYKYEDYNNVTVPYVDLLIESVDTIFDYIS